MKISLSFFVLIVLVASLTFTEAFLLFDVCDHRDGCVAIPCDSACASTGDQCGGQGICRSKSVDVNCIVCVSNAIRGGSCSADADCACGEVCVDGQGFYCDSIAT